MSDNRRIKRNVRKQHFDRIHTIHDDDKGKQRMYGGAQPKTTIINNMRYTNEPELHVSIVFDMEVQASRIQSKLRPTRQE